MRTPNSTIAMQLEPTLWDSHSVASGRRAWAATNPDLSSPTPGTGQPIRGTRCHLQRLTTPTGHLRHLWALSDRLQSFVDVSAVYA